MSVASEVRRKALAKRSAFLRVGDFVGVGSHAAIRQALSRLAREGELLQVREGLYWRGRKTRFGMSWPEPLQIAEALVGRGGVGYSGFSAANALGLTSQLPGTIEIAVPTRAPQSLENARFVSRVACQGRRSADLNALEVSLLETLERWDDLVDEPYEFAVDWLGRMFDSGDIRCERLVRASGDESARTRVRLKNLIREIGYPTQADSIRGASVAADSYAIAA